MYNLILSGLIGYTVRFLGFLPGIALAEVSHKAGNRINGGVIGFTGGLLIAFVSFEMLARAFEISGLLTVFLGIFIGIIAFAFAESNVDVMTGALRLKNSNKHIRAGTMLLLAVSMHNIAEGMAIGALVNVSVSSALKMALILLIHCIPETIAVAVPFRLGGATGKQLLRASFIMALPMCAGSMLGYIFSGISSVFAALFLGFSSGVMIYIACGEIIPESKAVWNGRFTPVCAGIGFITGIFITYIL